MEEFKFCFRLTYDDLVKYNKIITKNENRKVSLMLFTVAAIIVAMSYLFESVSPSLIAIFIVVFIAIILRPVWIKYILKKPYKKYFGFKKDTIVEFYGDHIVERSGEGESKIEFEEHFPLEAIDKIIETNEYYLFFISLTEAMLMPKRAITGEDVQNMNIYLEKHFGGKIEKRV